MEPLNRDKITTDIIKSRPKSSIDEALTDLANRVEKLRILYTKKPIEYKKSYNAAKNLLDNLNQNFKSYNNKTIDIIAFTGLSHMHIQQVLPILSDKKYGAWTRFLGHFRQLLNQFFSYTLGVAKTFENELIDFKLKADKLSSILQAKNKKLPEELIRLYPNHTFVISKCYEISPLSIKSASPNIIKKLIKNIIAPDDAVKAFPDDSKIVLTAFKIDQNSIRFASATVIKKIINIIPPNIIKELVNNKTISPDEAVSLFPEDKEIIKIAIANIKEIKCESLDDVIRLMRNHSIDPSIVVRNYPKNIIIIEAAFNLDPSSIKHADIEAINKLAEKNVIKIDDILKIFSHKMPTSQELLTIEDEFNAALTGKNWATVANICSKFWFEKPKGATNEKILETLKQSPHSKDLYKFGQFINFDDYKLTYGPLPKSPETYELEKLTRKMMENENFFIENINGDNYFKFTDGTEYNWTKIRANCDLQHIDLVQSDFDLFRKFMKIPRVNYYNPSNLSEWKTYLYLLKLYQGRIPESPMNFAEMMAINAYTGSSFMNMNELMYGKMNFAFISKDDIRQSLVLAVMCASGLRKMPMTEIKTSYRGASFPNKDFENEHIEAFLKKGVIKLSGFVSSSIEASHAMPTQPVHYTFHNLRGAYIAAISKFPSEKEYLIPPTQIQILSYNSINNKHNFESTLVSELGPGNTEQFESKLIKDLNFLSKINPETIITLIENGILQPQIALEGLPSQQKVALACFKKDQTTTLLLASPIIIKELLYNEHVSFDHNALASVLLKSPNKIKSLINNKTVSLENIVKAFPNNKEIILAAYAIDQTIIKFATKATIKKLMDTISLKDVIIAFPDDEELIVKAIKFNYRDLFEFLSLPAVIKLIKNNTINPTVAVNLWPNKKEVVIAAFIIKPESIQYAAIDVVLELVKEAKISLEIAQRYFPDNYRIRDACLDTAIAQNRNSLFANNRKDGSEITPEAVEEEQTKPK